jgi:hypothetical protein
MASDIFIIKMLLSFVMVFFWCLVYSVLGAIVLGCVPTLRVTVLNLISFVIGAFFGSFVILWAYGTLRLGRIEINPMFISLIAAAISGTISVWLKTRFIKTPTDTRLL